MVVGGLYKHMRPQGIRILTARRGRPCRLWRKAFCQDISITVIGTHHLILTICQRLQDGWLWLSCQIMPLSVFLSLHISEMPSKSLKSPTVLTFYICGPKTLFQVTYLHIEAWFTWVILNGQPDEYRSTQCWLLGCKDVIWREPSKRDWMKRNKRDTLHLSLIQIIDAMTDELWILRKFLRVVSVILHDT